METPFTVLAIGDIVGKPGRSVVRDLLPSLRERFQVDFVIANGENAAGGNAITPGVVEEFLALGIDVITTGNHVWDNKEIGKIIDTEPRLLRPGNYPEGVAGRGHGIYESKRGGRKVCVANLMGRVHMAPLDCPFRAFDRIFLDVSGKADILIVDFHAEATSEKRAFGWYADGRASAVFGTHTHVQTADEEIQPGGTAYITDIGMSGSFNSVIGMDREKSVLRFLRLTKIKYDVATGNEKLNGAVFRFSDEGRALSVERIVLEK
ncbi:MAG: TIGR00282 family metallophosphoesterase [Spirochaetes bacterium]|mgnify:CR=1 FL=1|jgi:metallophosphoesterase (TIGR00282 family)|nr:TIGR00282 family metallophosphoesterase [Spirochaetota bacterium]